ncbi:6848_t:CDS:10 [Ambispora leptoticha]|uniref:6848_t:CDS:1 n=1 Tax=Ambispora leptoticha TaxID=144679 RepID=A0A9N9F437_9GLOM|nr:6848_t:CDS:10 [Ambispora leptoticha]
MWTCKTFDQLLPQEILKEIKKDHSKSQVLLQARPVITATASAFLALATQLFPGTYSALGFPDQISSKLIREINVPMLTWQVSLLGALIYAAILFGIQYERLHATKLGIYSLIIHTTILAILGNGFHAIFFAVPLYGSIGRENNALPLSLVVWMSSYEQNFSVNQANIQRSLDEARTASKLMFISKVTHGILASVEILDKTQLNESQRVLLNTIESCGKSLLSVVNQVLTFAKLECGSFELENNVFDIFTLIQELGDGLAPIPEHKKLDFNIFSTVNPLHRFMIGDVGTIAGSDSGSGDEKEEQPWKEVRIRIEVTDTGLGIAPDFLNHIHLFSQEDSSLRRKFEGTGLGLSIVKGLLDMMHSRLEIKSVIQKGSNFSFCLTLPISSTYEDMRAALLPFSYEHLKLSEHKQETFITQLRSLSFVVLNNLNFLWSQQIVEYFAKWGFTYHLVEKENLKDECAKKNHDIIILDDSIDNLHWFLSEFKTQQQPIVAARAKQASMTAAVATTSTATVTQSTLLKEMQLTSTKTAIPSNLCVVFFSKITECHKAEKILKKFKPRSAVVVSKPGGPVKILTAVIKAMESIRSEKTTTCSSSSSLLPEDNDSVILLYTIDESDRSIREILTEGELFSSSSLSSVGLSTTDSSFQEVHKLQQQIEAQLLLPPLIKDEDQTCQQTEEEQQRQQIISSIKKGKGKEKQAEEVSIGMKEDEEIEWEKDEE